MDERPIQSLQIALSVTKNLLDLRFAGHSLIDMRAPFVARKMLL